MNDIFDNKVREKLFSAEVKAPAEVWNAVSGRIGSTADARSRHFGAWWGVAGAALCGAVASLAVFVFHKEDLTQMGDPVVIDVIRTENRLACEESVFSAGVKDLEGGLVPREATSVLYTAESAKSEAEVIKEPEQTLVFNPETIQKEEEWEDPFASMMAEDSRYARKARREKPSINVRGAVGANDAHSNSAFSRAQWTSGYNPEGMAENSVSTFAIPVSVGVSALFPLNERFSCSVGLDWSSLSRYFNGAYNTMEGEVWHYVNYVGLPVNLYYTFNPASRVRFYAFAGVSLEQCVSSQYYMFSESTLPIYKDKLPSLQMGVKAGAGISLRAGLVSVFFDPYVGYYFSESQPKSLRTEHPLMMSFDFGLRFNL